MIATLPYVLLLVLTVTWFDDILVPTAIVAAVTTVLLILYPGASVSESFILFAAIVTWYVGAAYLLKRAIDYFKN